MRNGAPARRLSLFLLIAAVAPLASPVTTAAGEVAYGTGVTKNVDVPMPDGTVLRADIHFPTDLATGQPAPGPFPVILTQTPYGKGWGSAAPETFGGANPHLISRGYLHVVADIRGTGASEGTFGLFDPEQVSDGVALVHWAAGLPHSDGRVGLIGPSYLGIIQLLTAAAIGPGSPLRAIFPIVAANDLYRDAAFGGGVPNIELSGWFLPLTAALHLANPILENRGDAEALLTAETQHLGSLVSFQLGLLADVTTDGDRAYEEDWWRARNPASVLDRIVANGVPAFLVGGWHDLFQRSAPMNYAGLQNAFAGRPVDAPMAPGQPVTGRYQLLLGPWYHVDYGDGVDLNRLALEWFDTWLKDAPTGMADTATPLHVYDLGAERWFDTARYPLEEAAATTWYLGEGGTLGPNPPAVAGGETGGAADTIVFTGGSSPCNRSTEQSGAGAAHAGLSAMGLRQPCTVDDSTLQVGPGALTYTTEPMAEPTVLAGPIGLTLYASSTRPDTLWVATVEDVAPSGTSTPITSGALLGSFRALDEDRTWRSASGRPLQPYHPYTRASATPVVPGEVTRYDIEIFPTLAELAPGHRLRLTLNTADSPRLLPTPAQLERLAGGVYSVHRHAAAASSLELPLAPAGAFATSCAMCR